MKKYNIIYADPPWKYNAWNKPDKGRTAISHYPVMGVEKIKSLPIKDLTAKDCTLFIWATFPCLREALEVIKDWGFVYKTVAFVWIKKNRKSDSLFWGLGHWTRANAEICLLATRGHPRRCNAGVHQVIVSPVEEHSKKPDEIRNRIIQLMGDLPKIELFARQKTDGWDAWGNEVEKSITLPTTEEKNERNL